MVLDGEIHKFQIGLDWDCCYLRKLLFTIIFMSQMLIAGFQILTMLGKVHHTINIHNYITIMYYLRYLIFKLQPRPTGQLGLHSTTAYHCTADRCEIYNVVFCFLRKCKSVVHSAIIVQTEKALFNIFNI